MVFNQFREEFPQLSSRVGEQFPAALGNAVVLSSLARNNLILAREIASRFQVVQDRVERPRTQVVPMPTKLLDHLDATDRFSLGMVKEMETHEAAKEMPNEIVAHG